jgi:hypothetical protein
MVEQVIRLYRYVGPKQIAERAPDAPAGTPIRSPADVLAWVAASGQQPGPAGLLIATFVIDQHGTLLVADRHSEHVACAGGQPVLSAGEITFRIARESVEVAEVSNQSTGYCPEPESWPAVELALAAAGFSGPGGFTPCCTFRTCTHCGQKNLVKNGIFECQACGTELPAHYNCQDFAR